MLQVCETAGLLLGTWKSDFGSAQGAGSVSQALFSFILQSIPWQSGNPLVLRAGLASLTQICVVIIVLLLEC